MGLQTKKAGYCESRDEGLDSVVAVVEHGLKHAAAMDAEFIERYACIHVGVLSQTVFDLDAACKHTARQCTC